MFMERRLAITKMRSDLYNLRTAQAAYFAEHHAYARTQAELGPLFSLAKREGRADSMSFCQMTCELGEPTIVVGKGWWTATNTHKRVPGLVCAAAINAANPVSGDTANSSEPACR